ncbi:MAG: 50S ribosomal protein L18 [Tissierellia bacterium]|jgi:large subunit ribosomal protein L18|nr:50S ribosomal protein L18 [Bacillota bacterium]NLK58896.1 50S ribosomal protein L18 [Tissierellia bacterium]
MFKRIDKKANRKARHERVRRNMAGTADKPRLTVFKSNSNIYAQLIDDLRGVTLCSASSLEKEMRDEYKHANVDTAKAVGERIAKRALEQGIETVVFDRSGYLYHGKVKELADSARAAGLKF